MSDEIVSQVEQTVQTKIDETVKKIETDFYVKLYTESLDEFNAVKMKLEARKNELSDKINSEKVLLKNKIGELENIYASMIGYAKDKAEKEVETIKNIETKEVGKLKLFFSTIKLAFVQLFK